MGTKTEVPHEKRVIHLKDQPHGGQSGRERPLADPQWGKGHEPAPQTPVEQEENTQAAPPWVAAH